jgi:hypothetical protein
MDVKKNQMHMFLLDSTAGAILRELLKQQLYKNVQKMEFICRRIASIRTALV